MATIESLQEYTGQQILLTSNRLAFVSKDSEHILFNSSGLVHTTSRDGVYFDIGENDETNTDRKFLVNAPKMQLGLDINGKVEPITKADELEIILNDLIDAISLYSDMVQTAAIVPGPLMAALLSPATAMLKGKLTLIKSNMINFKSDKSFTI